MWNFVKLFFICCLLALLLMVAAFYTWAHELITGEETVYDEGYNDDYYFM